MTKKILALSAALFLTDMIALNSCHAAQAAETLSTDELRDLQQKMKKASQLSVDFNQTKTNSLRPNKPSHSVGKASFAKPAKFRWELTKPAADTLIYDGTSLYSVKASDKTATRYDAKGERSQEIREVVDMVLDFDALLGRYNMVESVKDGQKIKISLKPKTTNLVTAVEVRVDAATATVQGIKMTFANKNTSEFEFSNPDRRAVAPTTFNVPKEYRVIDGL